MGSCAALFPAFQSPAATVSSLCSVCVRACVRVRACVVRACVRACVRVPACVCVRACACVHLRAMSCILS